VLEDRVRGVEQDVTAPQGGERGTSVQLTPGLVTALRARGASSGRPEAVNVINHRPSVVD
jgi:hypothetical protein